MLSYITMVPRMWVALIFMSLLLLLTLCISFVVICSTVQVPFEAGTPEQEYSFKWPIKRVAIIGAGPRYVRIPLGVDPIQMN